MQIKSDYFTASFISFVIHATIILYLTDFFYFEKQQRPILSKPVNVNLLFKDEAKTQIIKKEVIAKQTSSSEALYQSDNKIELTPVIPDINIDQLIQEEGMILQESEDLLVSEFSALIIQAIQSAWIKPKNIQDGLICDLRMTINKNGRVIKIDLIKSSGNIRFDNSAIKAISRVETFSFFNKIPFSMYQNSFKNIVITFNPA
ncbi:MAG: cell envelope integrity protein TolA [Proteobacteria bacterium]|jgi:TolA protein|nr:cell envelope integrity protein TolA [Pseudomonadota bacterium]MDC1241845.1 TonB C-terminal domain-containing protein [Gammaproteobacteria bacterium]